MESDTTMKQAHTKAVDTQGLRQALTTLAIAGALAGWAVMARPDAASTSATTATTGVAVAASSADTGAATGGAVVASSADTGAAGAGTAATGAAASADTTVAGASSGLRVVTVAPAPVTTTRSSR